MLCEHVQSPVIMGTLVHALSLCVTSNMLSLALGTAGDNKPDLFFPQQYWRLWQSFRLWTGSECNENRDAAALWQFFQQETAYSNLHGMTCWWEKSLHLYTQAESWQRMEVPRRQENPGLFLSGLSMAVRGMWAARQAFFCLQHDVHNCA